MTLRTEAELLALWERALPLAGPAREACLAAALVDDGDLAASSSAAPAPGASAGDIAGTSPPTLGAQRARLLRALGVWCGGRLALKSRCPACGEMLGFEVDPLALAQAGGVPSAPVAGPVQRLDHGPWQVHFRALAPGDLLAAAQGPDGADAEAFAARLLGRCVLAVEHEGHALAASEFATRAPTALLDELDARLQALDPLAALGFEVACPGCAHGWTAPFDVAQALWTHVQSAAERVLVEVDALARRYGWSEPEILALAPVRRRAYLQLAGLA